MVVLLVGTLLLLLPAVVYAHCPLCTVGAGAAALGASWLGIGIGPIGIFVGAFALAIGLWVAKLIPRQFVPQQDLLLGVVSFFTTVLPLRYALSETGSLYLSLAGEYGSILNRTYYFDIFLVASISGALVVYASPYISRWISIKRRAALPYQGVVITFGLLLALAALFEII